MLPAPSRGRCSADRLSDYAELIKEIKKPIRDIADRDQRFAYEKYAISLARQALGKPALDSYPSIFASNVPDDVAAIRDKYLTRRVYQLTEPWPTRRMGEALAHFEQRRADHQQDMQEARELLAETGVDRAMMVRLVRKEAARRHSEPSERVKRFNTAFPAASAKMAG